MPDEAAPFRPFPSRRARWASVALLILVAAAGVGAQASGAVESRVRRRADVPECVGLAIRELEKALNAPGETGSALPEIVVESLEQPALDSERAHWAAAVPAAAESFAIRRAGDGRIFILGRDAVGTMYGVFEAAEVWRNSGSLAAAVDEVRQPFLAFRGVNQFLQEDALQDPNSWFFQEAYWEGFFALLARTRHNVLDLHAGYNLVETNFPNIFPYFIFLDEFPGQCVGRPEATRNLAMLNRVIAIGKRHGVNVALMNYTVQGRKGEEKSEMFVGFDAARLAKYTYQASRSLLTSCPDLWIYGFRIGESGQPEDFFQKTYLAALADSGFRGKLYTRSWLATRKNLEIIKRGFPGDFYVEVKYNGEQLGLPYQAITSPTKFDPSYSYESYTDYPRGYKLLYQIRANGTTRIFHWGDPEFVARAAKSCRLGDAAGYSVEPMTAYYPMTDRYHRPEAPHYFQWTWQRDWFWYELWGRLGYDPEVAPGGFGAMFKERFGPAGDALYQLLTTSSRVIPLVGSAAALGPDQRQWAPEFETGNPDFGSLDGLRAFGNIGDALNVAPLDPTIMSSISDAAAAEIADRSDGRADARATAERLFSLASRIDGLLDQEPAPSANAEEARCIRLDAAALASFARFAGERYLALLNLAEYRLTSYPPALASAEHHLRWAREHWRRMAEVADGQYGPLLETERMRTQAYRWASQLPVLDGDLAYLTTLEQAWDSRQPAKVTAALAHLPGRGAQVDKFLPEDAAWPVQWRGSSYEAVEVGERPALRSQGGCLAFDVDDLLLRDVDADLAMDVSYWDPGPSTTRSVRVQFDGVTQPFGTLLDGGSIVLGGSRGWKARATDAESRPPGRSGSGKFGRRLFLLRRRRIRRASAPGFGSSARRVRTWIFTSSRRTNTHPPRRRFTGGSRAEPGRSLRWCGASGNRVSRRSRAGGKSTGSRSPAASQPWTIISRRIGRTERSGFPSARTPIGGKAGWRRIRRRSFPRRWPTRRGARGPSNFGRKSAIRAAWPGLCSITRRSHRKKSGCRPRGKKARRAFTRRRFHLPPRVCSIASRPGTHSATPRPIPIFRWRPPIGSFPRGMRRHRPRTTENNMNGAENLERRDFLKAVGSTVAFGMMGGPLNSVMGQTGSEPKPAGIARGVVFHDADGSGRRTSGQPGISGVLVSNGRQITRTAADGSYELPVAERAEIFVIKPRGWMVPLNQQRLPQFYYLHRPAGSPVLGRPEDAAYAHPGIAPTGPLPASIDFPLRPQTEPERFRALVFGDTQPANEVQIDWMGRDTIAELIDAPDVAFGLTVGDIVDVGRLQFMPRVNELQAMVGVPWLNIPGNHDLNYLAPNRDLSTETFKSIYGPETYAWEYGPVHFLMLANVFWKGFDGYKLTGDVEAGGEVAHRPQPLGRHGADGLGLGFSPGLPRDGASRPPGRGGHAHEPGAWQLAGARPRRLDAKGGVTFHPPFPPSHQRASPRPFDFRPHPSPGALFSRSRLRLRG